MSDAEGPHFFPIFKRIIPWGGLGEGVTRHLGDIGIGGLRFAKPPYALRRKALALMERPDSVGPLQRHPRIFLLHPHLIEMCGR